MSESNDLGEISLSKKVAITANMSALALIGNYALVFLFNVELGTSIIFVTAFVFGLQISVACVMIMSITFSTINPWGGFFPLIWVTQAAGWLFVAIVGSLLRDQKKEFIDSKFSPTLGAVGSFLTLFFDLATNLGYALTFHVPYIIALASGFWLMIVHNLTNFIFFSRAVPAVNDILMNQFKYAIWAPKQEVSEE